MFWIRLMDACNKIGLRPSGLAKILGFSNATATKWKSGSIPGGEALIKIADYLDCSIDYLLGRTGQPNAFFTAGNSLPDSIKKYLQLSPSGQKAADTMLDSLLAMEIAQQPPAPDYEKAIARLAELEAREKNTARMVAWGGNSAMEDAVQPSKEDIEKALAILEKITSIEKK